MRNFVKDPSQHWEDWWAWHPVYIYDDARKGWLRVWFEWVQRKQWSSPIDLGWNYRLP